MKRNVEIALCQFLSSSFFSISSRLQNNFFHISIDRKLLALCLQAKLIIAAELLLQGTKVQGFADLIKVGLEALSDGNDLVSLY